MKIYILLLAALPTVQGHSIDLKTAIETLTSEIWDFSEVRKDIDDSLGATCGCIGES